MNDSRCMRRSERLQQLLSIIAPRFQRQRPLFQPLGQSLALEELHTQVRQALVFAQIVNTANIRVSDATGDLYFLIKALEQLMVTSEFGRDYLDSDTLT